MKRGILALSLLAALFVGGCTRIGAGHVGIVVNLAGSQRGVQEYHWTTGWVTYNPAATQVVEYPTFVQTVVWTRDAHEGHPTNEEITFTTKDSMVVSMDVNLSYQLNVDKIPDFYVKFRSDDLDTFTHGYLRNAARNCINENAGKYSVEQIMGDNAPFLKDARNCLQAEVSPIGVQVQQFGVIGSPRPPQIVIDSINSKVQAGQIALQKNNEVLQAQADAKKAEANAEGQAASNRIVTGSLTPQLIEWQKLQLEYAKLAVQDRWIAHWNGVTPTTEVGGNPSLLLNVPAGK